MPSERRQINFRPTDETLKEFDAIKRHLEKRSGATTTGMILKEIIHVFFQSIPAEKKSQKKISKGT